jgi:hypothetical protein
VGATRYKEWGSGRGLGHVLREAQRHGAHVDVIEEKQGGKRFVTVFVNAPEGEVWSHGAKRIIASWSGAPGTPNAVAMMRTACESAIERMSKGTRRR